MFRIPKMPSAPEIRMGTDSKIPLSGGLCLKYQESALSPTQSPKMVNLNQDDRGSLIKRWGQSYVYPTSLGSGAINGIYNGLYKGKIVFAWGGNLYTQTGNSQPVQIYSGLANSKTTFFTFNSILYIMDGTNYMQYDGAIVKAVVPYIPTVYMLCSPDMTTSTVNESWNLLSSGFSVQYNGDGTSTAYTLPFKNLDATAVTATVNGTSMTEGSGFTVDRVNGKVTFTTAPSAAGNLNKNNVTITAYKAQAGLPQQILQCTRAIECYGVVFVTGNASMPNYYFAGGITTQIDASYFPQKRFYTLGGADKAVTGFAIHYGDLMVFKENMIARVTQTVDLNGNTSFPIDYINMKIGCDMPDSIQTANNDIIFANTYGGVYVLQRKVNVYSDDRVACQISGNINGIDVRPGLLQMNISDLKNASSYIFKNKYYLCITNVCYVWDFDISFYTQDNTDQSQNNLTWWYYTNVNANCWVMVNNVLIYGDRTNGYLCQFVNISNDFGQPIQASWRSKLMDFGYPDWEKTVNYIWLTTRANAGSAVIINYYDDNETLLSSAVVPSGATKSFTFTNFAFSNLTFQVQRFAPTFKDMPKLKKIVYFQLELSNANLNENLSLISLVIQYALNKKIR